VRIQFLADNHRHLRRARDVYSLEPSGIDRTATPRGAAGGPGGGHETSIARTPARPKYAAAGGGDWGPAPVENSMQGMARDGSQGKAIAICNRRRARCARHCGAGSAVRPVGRLSSGASPGGCL